MEKIKREPSKTRAQTPEMFDKQVKRYWEDMFGLLKLLNFNNTKYTITSVESPIMTNYLLWRVLSELKILNNRPIKT